MICNVGETPYKGLRVLLADDHAILRDGLKAILTENKFDVVGEAADGLEAVRLCQKLNPDIALMDISMPLLNGIDTAREIRQVSPKTKTMILSMFVDQRYVAAALRAGVSGYVPKSRAASCLTHAIAAVSRGDVYLSPSVSKVLVDAYLASEAPPPDPLSTREREVLQLIAEGKNVKEIGDLLGISTKTAESHRANIMHKLEIRDLPGLVRYAIKEGLIRAE